MTQESERMLSVDLMMMSMDAAVAKREELSTSQLVRCLGRHDESCPRIATCQILMRDIKAKQVDPAQLQGGMSGLDHSKMGHWSEGQSARLD